MPRKRIRGCFDSVTKLRDHDPAVLCEFLSQFPVFHSPELQLPDDCDPKKIPYDKILDALMSSKVPENIAVLLILINKLGNETGWEEIKTEARLRGVPLPFKADQLPYADRAMKAWTLAQPEHPDLLEESFARSRIYKKSSFTYYPMSRNFLASFRAPSVEGLEEMAQRFAIHFGEGTKVLVYEFDAEIWFLIRHPGIVQWQGVYVEGQTQSKALTPELYDAVVYHRKFGDLRMNTHKKSDHTEYRIAFGHLLFDDANVFDPNKKIVTLEPLKGDALKLCKLDDILGVYRILVSEVCFWAKSQDSRRVTWRSRKENESLPLNEDNWVVPADTEFVLYAKFRYKLSDSAKWQGLTVHTGKTLSYERDGDSCVLEDWLRERKIINAGVA
jgi:hypothetical protein